MRIKQPSKVYDPVAIEGKINTFWSETQAYKRTESAKSKGNKFYFVDGPPFTTGSIHLGMAWNKILKDAVIRYKRLQGFDVRDQAGFDMHGLPIEVKVEQSLGITNKKDISELGVETFVSTCRNFASDLQQKMTEQFMSLGVWLDWEDPYLSIDNSYIESAWFSLKKIHGKDLLTKANSVLAWCPRCETALAEAEIEYSEITDPSLYLKLPIRGRRDEYIIVWTTMPWTILANLAVAVHPDLNYSRVKVRAGGRKETLIILEEGIGELARIASIDAYEIVETIKGKELEGLGYFHPMMADIPFQKDATGDFIHKILAVDSVAASHTGCVHVAPGHGQEDFNIGLKHNIPIFSPVDERGLFTTEVGAKYAGKGVRETNDTILADLKAMRFILHDSMESHRHGHCWRCQTPILYRATEQWFLRVADVKDKLLKAVNRIKWTPGSAGSSKQHDWIMNARDWCISRQRYWGIPLPIWECLTDVCAHIDVVGSSKELEKAMGYTPGMDLHRPWIDEISLECPKCGGLMKRVPDTIDVWFDSGICSWAQLKYPQKKKTFKTWWPGDWITESHNQTRGWFYSQLCASIMMFGKIPFKSVLVHGRMYDSDNHPISKSIDELLDPTGIVDKYGADALRLSLLGHSAPWEDITFNVDDVQAAQRTLRVLWNVFVFSTTYMTIDNYDPFAKTYNKVRKDLQPEDNWLLSRIETLTNDMKKEMESFRLDKASKLLEDFVLMDLSRWYIKIIRERMWKEEGSPEKEAAYKTLHEALTKLAVISSPIIPYISEEIYQALDGRELTVHMCSWPEFQIARVAEGLEKGMTTSRQVVEFALKLRQKNQLKLRWPVKNMIISSSTEDISDAVSMFKDVIKSQVNVKRLEVVPPGEEWEGQELEVIPNPNIIGKAYKQWESKIARMLKVLPAKEVKEKITKGEYQLGIEGQNIRILPDMVTFKTKLPKNIISEEFSNGIIYLDMTRDDEIVGEGFSREIVRRIQEMRKDMEMDLEEYIKISITMSGKLADLIDDHLERIVEDTRANLIEITDDVDGDYIIEWEIEDEDVVIGVTALDIKKAMDEFIMVPGIERKLALSLVEAGVTGSAVFADSQRDFLLKVPGMTHAKLRKIKEFYEAPEDLRESTEVQRCPFCEGEVEFGASVCERCGKSLDEDERDLDVELVGGLAEEEELADSLLDDEMLLEGEEELEEDEEEEEEEKPAAKKPKPSPILPIPMDELSLAPADASASVLADETSSVRADDEASVVEDEPVAEEMTKPVTETIIEPVAEPSAELTDETSSVLEDEAVPEPDEKADAPASVPADAPASVLVEEEQPPLEEQTPIPTDQPSSVQADDSPSDQEEEKGIDDETTISNEMIISGVFGFEPPPKEIEDAEPEEIIPPEESGIPEPDLEEPEPDVPLEDEIPEPDIPLEGETPEPDIPLEDEIPEPDVPLEDETPEPDIPLEDEIPEPEAVVVDDEPLPEEKTVEEPEYEHPAPEEDDGEPSAPKKEDDIIGGDRDRFINELAESIEVKPSVANLLYNNNYRTVESLQGATEEDLRNIKGIGKVTARKILSSVSTDETQMCTLCNAIVPAEARACPRCGVKFISEDEKDRDFEKQMTTLDLLEKKLKRKPDDVNLLYSKTRTLMDAGRKEDALEILNSALELAPDDERLKETKALLVEGPEVTHKDVKEEYEKPEEPSVMPEEEGPEEVPVPEPQDEVEEPIPPVPLKEESPEEKPESDKDDVELKESFTYLIPEERSSRSYKLLRRMTDSGMPGFCITRTFPEKIRERYKLGDIPILWLSNVSKEDTVRPKDLEKLSLSLEEFLSKRGGIVLLDGIEYLVTNNNFITVLKLIQSLRDQVAINRSILLLSINPSTMEGHQINLLKREVDTVIEDPND